MREQIMLAGRAHPAGMAAVGEYMLEKGLKDPTSAIYRAFTERYPDIPPEEWQERIDVNTLKKNLFAEIRNAVMNVKPKLENGEVNPEYAKSPIFRHFSDRHIMKLDYNENDRVVNKSVVDFIAEMCSLRVVPPQNGAAASVAPQKVATIAFKAFSAPQGEPVADSGGATRVVAVPFPGEGPDWSTPGARGDRPQGSGGRYHRRQPGRQRSNP